MSTANYENALKESIILNLIKTARSKKVSNSYLNERVKEICDCLAVKINDEGIEAQIRFIINQDGTFAKGTILKLFELELKKNHKE
jgi:S-adenosylmethionine synthetase